MPSKMLGVRLVAPFGYMDIVLVIDIINLHYEKHDWEIRYE